MQAESHDLLPVKWAIDPTAVGMERWVVSPCPSGPKSLRPQVNRLPSLVIATIPTGTNSAVGSVRGKMLKYRQLYGPGAIVFAYGGGESLACDLHKIDVITLDSYPLDQTKVCTCYILSF